MNARRAASGQVQTIRAVGHGSAWPRLVNAAAAGRGVGLARRIWNEAWEDEIPDRAAALSYYLVFALFPALLFLTALVGLFPGDVMDRLMEWLDQVLPSDVVHKTFVEVTRDASGKLLSVGIAAAFWAASSGMAAIMSALNAVYDITDRRPWWRQRLVAFGLTLGVALFTPAAFVLLIFGEELGAAVSDWLGLGQVFAVVWAIARWPAAAALAVVGIGLVYQFAPARRRQWRWLTPGAVFAAGTWFAMSLVLRLYVVTLGNYNATYGSIAGVILTLLWLYLSGLALLLGAELDAELRGDANHTPPDRQAASGTEIPGHAR